MQKPVEALKRRVLMWIVALSWLGTAAGWGLMEWLGQSSPVLRLVFGANILFHPVLFVIAWRRWLPQRVLEFACLVFAAGLCAACMMLRLYWPEYGASIDLQPLYLWIPVIYVFPFALAGHRTSLRISLVILGAFVLISLPYLLRSPVPPHANFTIQLIMVSAVLIAALYFFSSYQHRFHIAQLTLDELARMANTDELTGLANRRRMVEAMEAEQRRFARYGHGFTLILADIDHFKDINDRFGHDVGDEALIAFARRSAGVLRDVDLMGRWGGEEFVVILPETPYEQGLERAEALCGHLAAEPLIGNLPVTISCGVAAVGQGDDITNLLQRADRALYAAKRGGRNRVEGVRA